MTIFYVDNSSRINYKHFGCKKFAKTHFRRDQFSLILYSAPRSIWIRVCMNSVKYARPRNQDEGEAIFVIHSYTFRPHYKLHLASYLCQTKKSFLQKSTVIKEVSEAIAVLFPGRLVTFCNASRQQLLGAVLELRVYVYLYFMH